MSDLSDVDELVLDLQEYGDWLRRRSGVSLSPPEPAGRPMPQPSPEPGLASRRPNWSQRTLITAVLALIGLGATAVALTTFGSSSSPNNDPTGSSSPARSAEENRTEGDRPTISVTDDQANNQADGTTDDPATDGGGDPADDQRALDDPNNPDAPNTGGPSTTVPSNGPSNDETEPSSSSETSSGGGGGVIAPPSSPFTVPKTTELYPDNTISSTEAPDPGQPPTSPSNSPSTSSEQTNTTTLSALRILSPRPFDTIDPRFGFTIRVDDLPGAQYTYVGRQEGQTVFEHTSQQPSFTIPGTLISYGGPRLEEGQLELTVTATTAQGDQVARLVVPVRQGFRPTYGS